jgi:hypothetical protein
VSIAESALERRRNCEFHQRAPPLESWSWRPVGERSVGEMSGGLVSLKAIWNAGFGSIGSIEQVYDYGMGSVELDTDAAEAAGVVNDGRFALWA